MPGPGNPVFAFRVEDEKAKLFRETAALCGYVEPGELLREFMDCILERNHAKLHSLLRWIDRGVGVQLDLALMSKPGGPVLPRKRVARANRARIRARGGSPP